VADRTGLSRSRAYALLREERARLTAGNGHQPTLDPTDTAPYPAPRPAREGSTAMRVHLRPCPRHPSAHPPAQPWRAWSVGGR
jgi:hypothetical protein